MPTDLALFDSTMKEHLKRVTERIAGLAVVDQQSYITAGQAMNDAKSIVKEWEKQADAEIDPIKDSLDRARNKWKTYIEPGKILIKALGDRLNMWKEEERKAAIREQQRINEERRIAAEKQAAIERAEREKAADAERKARDKEIEAQRKAGEIKTREAERLKKEAAEAAEREKQRAAQDAKEMVYNVPQVSVKPSIPTVAGIKSQVYYFGEVLNGAEIIAAYTQAAISRNPERQRFLLRFMTVNDVEVGKFARETKDSEKAAQLLPGVKFTQRG